jgi:hypothetical protein
VTSVDESEPSIFNPVPMPYENCPHCDKVQLGTMYGDLAGNAYCTSRTIHVVVRDIYEGTLFLVCPDCDRKYHYWPEGHPLWYDAEAFVSGEKTTENE